jgi:uncharacterized RDD family membrane protein YckC
MSSNPWSPASDSSFEASYEMPLADRGARFLAALVDGLAIIPIGIPVALAFLAEDSDGLLVGLVFALVIGLGIGCVQWYLIATSGQTVGKRALGIRIVKIDGSPVDFVSGVVMRSWVMNAICNIPYVGPLIGLVDVLMIFGEERRCLHDRIAGTKVVEAV